MSKPKLRQRIFLINRDFQFRYARAASAVGLISTGLTAVLILYPLFVFKILVIPQFLPRPILAAMFFAALLNISLIVIFAIIMTHRIAGPMYSMTRQMRAVAKGDFRGSMFVRQADDLKYVIRNFNDMIDGLSKVAQDDEARILLALEKVKAADAASLQGAIKELEGLANDVRRRTNKAGA